MKKISRENSVPIMALTIRYGLIRILVPEDLTMGGNWW